MSTILSSLSISLQNRGRTSSYPSWLNRHREELHPQEQKLGLESWTNKEEGAPCKKVLGPCLKSVHIELFINQTQASIFSLIFLVDTSFSYSELLSVPVDHKMVRTVTCELINNPAGTLMHVLPVMDL